MQNTIHKLEKYAAKMFSAVENNKKNKLDSYMAHQNKYFKVLLNNQRGGADIDIARLNQLFDLTNQLLLDQKNRMTQLENENNDSYMHTANAFLFSNFNIVVVVAA